MKPLCVWLWTSSGVRLAVRPVFCSDLCTPYAVTADTLMQTLNKSRKHCDFYVRPVLLCPPPPHIQHAMKTVPSPHTHTLTHTSLHHDYLLWNPNWNSVMFFMVLSSSVCAVLFGPGVWQNDFGFFCFIMYVCVRVLGYMLVCMCVSTQSWECSNWNVKCSYT